MRRRSRRPGRPRQRTRQAGRRTAGVVGRPGSAGFAGRPCEPATHAAAHEVVDLVPGDELLELGQARRRVGSGETADRHDRDAVAAQFYRGRAGGADRGRGPPVAGRPGLQPLGQGDADTGLPAESAAGRGGQAPVCAARESGPGAGDTEGSGHRRPGGRDRSALGRRCGVCAVGQRGAQAADQGERHRGCRQDGPAPAGGRAEGAPGQDHAGGGGARDDDDHAQPREPARTAVEQDPRPDGGDREPGGQDGTSEPGVPHPPQLDGPDADERADRGGQGDGVVGVDDSGHVAEDQPGQ